MRRWIGRGVAVLGVVLWVLVPVVCIVAVRGRAERVRLRGNEASSVEVLANTQERVTDAGLRLTWASHSPVVAPAWAGTVTNVRAKAGEQAVDGALAMTIDGVDRMLVASRRPFSRPLALGDAGPDVAELNDLLRRRGLEPGSSDRFGPATQRGVTAFAEAIGAGPATTFDPAWVLFLSQSGARISAVTSTVGAPALSPGEAVLTLAPDLVIADVIPHQDAPPDAAATDGAAPGGTDEAPGAAPAAGGGAASESLLAVVPIEVPKGSVLRLDTAELALSEDRTSISPKSLETLRDLVGVSTRYIDASFSAPAVTGELIVPAAAVIADQQGGTCVRTAGHGARRSVPVVVIGGDGGQSTVIPADPTTIAAGDRVEVAVPAGERSCHSR